MSRSKELQRSRRSDWLDASQRHPCPICARTSWCQIHRHEPVALCKRVESDRKRVNAEGVEFFVHRYGGDSWEPSALPPAPPAVAIAPPRVRDEAYRAVLARCPLSGEHRANLRGRGLDDATIAANGYGSLPREGRSAIAAAVLERVGEAATGVPGYRVGVDGARSWASFAGSPGLLIPCRNVDGLIVALKVRRDEADDGPRYLYVSSARHGGASAEPALHVPHWADDRRAVMLTEGELKADVATALGGMLCVSAPGVGLWPRAVPALDGWGTRRVHVAFDADARTNAHVGAALRAAVRGLEAAGFTVTVATWDAAAGKGIDDVLAARARAA